MNELNQLDVRFALVGGFAVGLRTEPRFTQDLDLAVSVTEDSHAEQTTMSLISRGYSLLAMVEQDSVGRLATVRLISPETKIVVDLLFASSGIEPDIVAEAGKLDFSDALTLPVAQIGHLIAMKILSHDGSRRPREVFTEVKTSRRCLGIRRKSSGYYSEMLWFWGWARQKSDQDHRFPLILVTERVASLR